MVDQLKRSLNQKHLRACILESAAVKVPIAYEELNAATRDCSDSDDMEPSRCKQTNNVQVTMTGASVEEIRAGEFQLIYGHPEAFLSSTLGQGLIKDEVFTRNVVAVVYDEAHCVLEWGEDFRQDYGKLSELGAFFPDIPHCGLTATLRSASESVLCEKLGLVNPQIVKVNPDRPNVYLDVQTLDPAGDKWEAYDNILFPIAECLKIQKLNYPLTLIYAKRAQLCGYAYSLFDTVLGEDQYVPRETRDIRNRLFAQYHANYPKDMKEEIINVLTSDSSVTRVVVSTTALGMGLNVPDISQVIVISPPGSIETFFQMAGRAGRNGELCTTRMHFSKTDIRKNAPGMTDEMRNLCLSTECVRKQILTHLGYSRPEREYSHTCCNRCRLHCSCYICSILSSLVDLVVKSNE